MAAIRLDDKPDQIERVLDLSLVNKTSAATSSQYTDREASVDPLASSTWEEVLYFVCDICASTNVAATVFLM